MRTDIRQRLWLIWWGLEAMWLSVVNLTLFCVEATAAALVTVWVGIPVLLPTVGWTRRLAERRRRALAHFGGEIESPYLRRSVEGSSPLARVRALADDPAIRRDVYWGFVDGTVGMALSIAAFVEALLDLALWWLPLAMAARAHAALDRSLLGVSEKSRLALRVEQLTESRAETVDTQATELRRIERDLHDGAQARLVALGMNLALAEDELARDPEAARTLLTEARTSSSAALAELRDLVRGIHPPVLADRGLVGAVQALALASPTPVAVVADVPGRLPAPVESAAYFAVAEGIANAIKHSSAQAIEVRLAYDGEQLQLVVHDDGRGGADTANGTGLAGIARRLSAFDGTLEVASPAGAGTELRMALPYAR